jgi:hypothetical protein
MHRTLTKMALKENFKLSLRWGVVAREKPRKAMKGKERKERQATNLLQGMK